jgi:hypothetical protein
MEKKFHLRSGQRAESHARGPVVQWTGLLVSTTVLGLAWPRTSHKATGQPTEARKLARPEHARAQPQHAVHAPGCQSGEAGDEQTMFKR